MQTPKTYRKNTKPKPEVLNIKFFFEIFNKENHKYARELFHTDHKVKRGGRQKVDKKLYKRIVLEFFKMYFFEFFSINKSLYFPFGGYIKKVVYPTWVRFQKGRKAGGDKALGIYWYLRPSQKMYFMVELKKLTGTTNRIPVLEAHYKNSFNKDLLPIFKTELKQSKKNKTLYLCSLD